MASQSTDVYTLPESPNSPERLALTPNTHSTPPNEPSYTLPPIRTGSDNALYNANITIAALQQQLATSERHAHELGAAAAEDAARLDYELRCSRAREAQLEHNITYLSTEVEKANAYNHELNTHIRLFHRYSQQQTIPAQQVQEQQMMVVQESEGEGQSQGKMQTAVSAPGMAPAQVADGTGHRDGEQDSAAPPKRMPPSQNAELLLSHSQNIIRSLRSEIRKLKAKRAELEGRLAAQG